MFKCVCASGVFFCVGFENSFFFACCTLRLQHSNLPGPKSFQPSKKTASPQEYIHDTAEIDKVIFLNHHSLTFNTMECVFRHFMSRVVDI